MALPPRSPDFQQYFEDIINHSRYAHLQGSKRERKIDELHNELLDALSQAYLDALSPVDRTAYDHMRVKHTDGATLRDFLARHINQSEITHQVFTAFKQQHSK